MHAVSSTSQFKNLLEELQPAEAISLVMPTVEASREVEQNRIRFRNLVKQIVIQLTQLGMAEQAAERKLKPFTDRYNDGLFWQHQSKGLAAYLVGGEAVYHHLLHSPDELVTVGKHYFVTPLATDVSRHQTGIALALTWDAAKLYRVSRTEWEEVDDELFPVTLREIVLPPDTEEQLQMRSQQSAVGPGVQYHGQGEGEAIIESDRWLFLSEVGKRLNKELEDNDRTVYLAATEDVAGHFFSSTDFEAQGDSSRSTSKKSVVEVRLSPSQLTEEQLKQRVRNWMVVERTAADGNEEAESGDSRQLDKRLGTALSQGLATREISEALHAAAIGRVEELIYNASQRTWGTWDSDQLQATVSKDQSCPGQECIELVNMTILKTWQTGGRVQAVANTALGLTPLAAFFRY